MKLRNKILAAIMIMAASMTFVAVSALAAPSLSLTPSATEVKAGETFTVAIDINENPGIMSLQVGVTADGGATLTGVTDAKLLAGATIDTTNLSNPFFLTWNDALATDNTTTNGTVATMTYSVPADAVAGTEYEITAVTEAGNTMNVDWDEIDFGTAVATIKVVSDEPVTPPAPTTETRYYTADLARKGATGVTFTLNDSATVEGTYSVYKAFQTAIAEAESVTVGLIVENVLKTNNTLTVSAQLEVK